jgi:hypothetical protein
MTTQTTTESTGTRPGAFLNPPRRRKPDRKWRRSTSSRTSARRTAQVVEDRQAEEDPQVVEDHQAAEDIPLQGNKRHHRYHHRRQDAFIGKEPQTFTGDRTKADEFFTQWNLFVGVNYSNSAMTNAFSRSMLFLTYMQGPHVNEWVLQQHRWLVNEGNSRRRSPQRPNLVEHDRTSVQEKLCGYS